MSSSIYFVAVALLSSAGLGQMLVNAAQSQTCAPIAPAGADPSNYSWRDNRCEGIVEGHDKPRQLQPVSLVLAGQPRPKARYTLSWPSGASDEQVTIRITSRKGDIPRLGPKPSTLPRRGYQLDATAKGARFEFSTIVMRTLGVSQADTTFEALATTTQLIDGRQQLIYLPLDVAQERRFGFGRYILHYSFAAFAIEDIKFTATRLSQSGSPSGEVLPLESKFVTRDAGLLAYFPQLVIDLSKQVAGTYRVDMKAVKATDKSPIAAAFLLRHGSTDSEK